MAGNSRARKEIRYPSVYTENFQRKKPRHEFQALLAERLFLLKFLQVGSGDYYSDRSVSGTRVCVEFRSLEPARGITKIQRFQSAHRARETEHRRSIKLLASLLEKETSRELKSVVSRAATTNLRGSK